MNLEQNKLVIQNIPYSEKGLKSLERISPADRQVILDRNTVYIVNEQSGKQYKVYVGETNNIQKRTLQHLKDKDDVLQQIKDGYLYVIGDSEFQKSMTLDIENELINYFLALPGDVQVLNGRGNPQGSYAGSELKDQIFKETLKELNSREPELFPEYGRVLNSTLFKASPFKTLSDQQKKVKSDILALVSNTIKDDGDSKLITVAGAAGTGKTVLLSSLFYEVATAEFGKQVAGRKLKVAMIVNHDEQRTVYSAITKRLKAAFGEEPVVFKPTEYLNAYMKKQEQFDVVLVDEAHLVWTQGHMAAWTKKHFKMFGTENQLKALAKTAKITIAIFDPKQILRADQSWDEDAIADLIQGSDVTYSLTQQYRIQANEQTRDWIDSFVAGDLKPIPHDFKYDLREFDDAKAMFEAIQMRDNEIGLSRLLATFDWDYKLKRRIDGEPWMVTAGNLVKPWNLQTPGRNKSLAWSEDPVTIDEVGSTFTIQGLDLNYAGVILGPSIKYRDGKIVIDARESHDKNAIKTRLDDGLTAEEHLRNALNVLMKRGVHGLYLYAVDEELRKQLRVAGLS